MKTSPTTYLLGISVPKKLSAVFSLDTYEFVLENRKKGETVFYPNDTFHEVPLESLTDDNIIKLCEDLKVNMINYARENRSK